jgi:DNA-binding winged helix-turn-helix (wHTH) protein
MGGGSDRSGQARRPAATVLCVRTLGKLTLRVGERTIGAIGRKSAALLAYLALSDSGQETRERLVGLLWSETEEEKARASLRQSLHEIREAFNVEGFEGFRTTKSQSGSTFREQASICATSLTRRKPDARTRSFSRRNGRSIACSKSLMGSTLHFGSGWLPSGSRSATG